MQNLLGHNDMPDFLAEQIVHTFVTSTKKLFTLDYTRIFGSAKGLSKQGRECTNIWTGTKHPLLSLRLLKITIKVVIIVLIVFIATKFTRGRTMETGTLLENSTLVPGGNPLLVPVSHPVLAHRY